MTIQQRTAAFVNLGNYLNHIVNDVEESEKYATLDKLYFKQAQELFSVLKIQNGWFTESNVRTAIRGISQLLNEENLKTWLARYPILDQEKEAKKVGLILAGNIPLVGFHDFLTVLLSGNIAVVKLSSDDKILLPFVVKLLCRIEPKFESKIIFEENKLGEVDAVIATGSGNTARYFDYYFGKIPHVIRKNRNSVAVLSGRESQAELSLLGNDIFSYFGLGCRNVSKLFVPENYDLSKFFTAIFPFQEIIYHNKYANNFDYNRAVYLMGKDKEGLLENGFLFLVKSKEYASPVAVLFYEYYSNLEELNNRLKLDSEKIQCIVANLTEIENCIPFGKAQNPDVWDYADNIDTLKFLSKIN
jgi:hypothetical protein